MFYLKDPATLDKPWVLSNFKDEKTVSISKEVTKDLRTYHILGINFLYQNYKRKFKGAILNEEDGMNMKIQVCAFLNAVYKCNENNLLNIVICPDSSLRMWKYHLSNHGNVRFKVIDEEGCPENLDAENNLTLIICFSNLKLVEQLAEYDYFSIIIDDHDLIATKMVMRKITGLFHIGLTKRNFYIQPDQKVQWTMLNWSNPGCVGKLKDFYEIDKNNLTNFRDNYRHWWFRLTWRFCESFKEITKEELKEYNKKVQNWCNIESKVDVSKRSPDLDKKEPTKKSKSVDQIKSKDIENPYEIKVKKMGFMYKNAYTKRNPSETVVATFTQKTTQKNLGATVQPKCATSCYNIDNTTENKKTNKYSFIDVSKKSISPPVKKTKGKRKAQLEDLDKSFENDPSPERLPLEDFYKHSYSTTKKLKMRSEDEDLKSSNYVKLPSMDEHPIVDSIIRNFEKSPGPAKKQPFSFSTLYNEPNCSKAFEIRQSQQSEETTCSQKDESHIEVSVDNGADEFFKSLITSRRRNDSEETIIEESEQLDNTSSTPSISVNPEELNTTSSKSVSIGRSIDDDDIQKLLEETDLMLESS